MSTTTQKHGQNLPTFVKAENTSILDTGEDQRVPCGYGTSGRPNYLSVPRLQHQECVAEGKKALVQ